MAERGRSNSGTTRYLPQMVGASVAVTLIPLAAIWGMRSSGLSSSPWVCVPLAVVISLAVSAAGSAYWQRRRPAAEVMFSDLMMWNWLRRRRTERTIRDTTQLLRDPGDASPHRRAHLLRQLASSLDAQDPYTIGHSRRVARHSAIVARKLGLTAEQTRKVRAAAAVHDIGKLRIEPTLLNKPGRLTDSEFAVIKTHAESGAKEVSHLGDGELTAIVRHHHERLDGSGYPSGLAGEMIPLGARIIAVTDTFDAMTSVRPYRPARPHKQALDILRREAGRQLDPRVVEAFIACYAGRRTIAAWATLSALPQTAVTALGGSARTPAQARISPSHALVTTATMAAVVGLAVATPIVSHHRLRRNPRSAGAIIAAAPIVPGGATGAAHRQRVAHRRARAGPFNPVVAAATTPPRVTSFRTQLARARTPMPRPHAGPARHRGTSSPPTSASTPTTAPTPTPTSPTTTTPRPPDPGRAPPSTTGAATSPPPAGTSTTTPTTSASAAQPATSTSTSVTTTTTITRTTTNQTPTPSAGDPCKDGGWVGAGYRNQGACESELHRHHGG